jgi:hypothetical protein
MPTRRGRTRKGERRIDAAIDHFVVMGYDARDISAVVADLLKVIFDYVLSLLSSFFLQAASLGYGGVVGFWFPVSPRIDWGSEICCFFFVPWTASSKAFSCVCGDRRFNSSVNE